MNKDDELHLRTKFGKIFGEFMEHQDTLNGETFLNYARRTGMTAEILEWAMSEYARLPDGGYAESWRPDQKMGPPGP